MDYYGHLMEGPPQTGLDGGFPSEPKEDLGSNRVINKTSKQVVQSEEHAKTTKFMFFLDCSTFVSCHVIVISEFEWRGGVVCQWALFDF